jgi:hypothetical protein
MSDQTCSVGEGLSRAIVRAEELRLSSPRRVRVRIVTKHGDLDPGVIVVANIASRTGPELEAQMGKGVRYVPLAELDARAHELPSLVDEAAAEIEAAVAGAPPPPKRPSEREDDFDVDAYEDLIESSYRAMVEASGSLATRSVASFSAGGVAEAVAAGALKVAALSAIGGRIEFNDLVDMLKQEFNDVRERASRDGVAQERVH